MKNQITSITNLATTTTTLTAVESKIPNDIDFIKKLAIKQKLMKLKIK